MNQSELCKAVRELRLQAWRVHEMSRKQGSNSPTVLLEGAGFTNRIERIRQELDVLLTLAHTGCTHDDE